MALIETEEAAGRLARVIVSDIEIYNRQKIASGGDLTRELEEGFSLFQSRVVPALLPLFESVLSDRGLLAGKLPPALARAAARYADLRSDAAARATAEAPRAAQPEPAIEAVTSPLTEAPAPAAEPEAAAESVPATPEDAATQAARRLARVIVSDIVIYNTKKIAAGGSLTHEINEGRALFKSRVAAEHLPIYEALLVERGLVRPAPAAAAPVASPRSISPVRSRAASSPGLPAVAPSPVSPFLPAVDPADVPTPPAQAVPVAARFIDPPTPVVDLPTAHEALTPVVETLPAALAALPAVVETLPPSFEPGSMDVTPPPAEPTQPAPNETVGPPPSNDWDVAPPSRPRGRPLPPPIPVEARVQAVRAAALDVSRPQPDSGDSGDNAIMTSALELPVSAPAASVLESAVPTFTPPDASERVPSLESLLPRPAPAAALPAPLPDAAPAGSPLTPLQAPALGGLGSLGNLGNLAKTGTPRKNTKARLVIAAAAILTAAATTYYLLSFWPNP